MLAEIKIIEEAGRAGNISPAPLDPELTTNAEWRSRPGGGLGA